MNVADDNPRRADEPGKEEQGDPPKAKRRIVIASTASLAVLLVVLGSVGVTSLALSRRSQEGLIDGMARQNQELSRMVDRARHAGKGGPRIEDCKRAGGASRQ